VLKKPARQGSKAENKEAYTDVSDRHLLPKLAQQAKISSIFRLSKRFLRLQGLSVA